MRFTHVYVEERAREYPLTSEILGKLPGANVIPIKHYKDVFDRKRQNAVLQRERKALIIAVRDGNRIFKGAPVCQSFGNSHFFYTSCVMNCIFEMSSIFIDNIPVLSIA